MCHCALLVLLCLPDASLAEARERFLRGNYAEAQALYEKALPAPTATLGLCRVLQAQGEYAQALAKLDAACKAEPKHAELQAARALALADMGRDNDAAAALKLALEAKPDLVLGHWIAYRLAWTKGDLKTADAELRWIVRYYGERITKDQEIKDPDELLLVGKAATENARWHRLGDQFSMVLNDIFAEAMKLEKFYWPAEYESGLLLLQKYNRAEALAAFNKILTINPQCALAFLGRAMCAYQGYEMREAELLIERALKINPRLPEALRLQADLHWVARDLKRAKESIQRALAINPIDEESLGRLAACHADSGDEKALATLEQEVAKRDPTPGVFYLTLAAKLEERKRYALAEAYYKKAQELRPMIPEIRNGLGMLHMRLGREKEAKEVLTAAFAADEFNVRVSNSLKVLKHLDNYKTLETEHFEIRYDPKLDRQLAGFLGAQLEEFHALLKAEFQYAPPGKILYEVFNNHEMFSGRTVALPDLHTIGASTGRIIAMVSPQGKGLRRAFNWGRVFRHELVHVFNLEQTNFQCPHWFTEGLAVLHEGFPRPPQWNQILKQRVASGELFDLDSIDLGFIRPKSPLDWSLAYAQSSLYVTYLRQTYGPKTIGLLLAAYAQGKTTPEALEQVCGVTKDNFEAGYTKYLQEVAAEMGGKREEKKLSLGQLQKEVEKDPKNDEMAARLAEQLLIRRDRKEARKLVDMVLARKPTQALASYVKARLLQDAGEDDAARELLEKALDRNQPEMRILQTLGKLYYESRVFDKAADVYELAYKQDQDPAWLVELVRVYTQKGDRAKLADTLSRLTPTDPDDLDLRKRLAALHQEAKRWPEAERVAREALEIDVRDVEVHEILDKALREQKKVAEADRFRKLLGGS